ncbi:hypothetical protein BZG36_00968 [Bifiguratus adelaidae]|uniref:Uncharacterized protein n=1 Tax=Bifiguratus adelaidae TaxID=1938954 RepID=A0A261Y6A8_9FUNG|nr:hypothetical protein BZG36_00968 [Bifiguratus adelaidae]
MDAMDMVTNSSSLLMGSDSSTAKEFTSHVKTPYFIPSPSSQIYDDIIQGDQSALSGYLFPSFEDDKPYCPSGVPYGWIQDDIRMEETYTVDEDSIDTALFLSELEDFMQEIEYEDLRSSLVHDIPDECK